MDSGLQELLNWCDLHALPPVAKPPCSGEHVHLRMFAFFLFLSCASFHELDFERARAESDMCEAVGREERVAKGSRAGRGEERVTAVVRENGRRREREGGTFD